MVAELMKLIDADADAAANANAIIIPPAHCN